MDTIEIRNFGCKNVEVLFDGKSYPELTACMSKDIEVVPLGPANLVRVEFICNTATLTSDTEPTPKP